jgi:hypothetical protein
MAPGERLAPELSSAFDAVGKGDGRVLSGGGLMPLAVTSAKDPGSRLIVGVV